MIRILIADDHAVVRLGLRWIMQENPDIRVVGEASGGEELFALIQKEHADVVILDISMQGRSGLELLTDLRRAHPKVAVLILSIYPEEQYAVRALKLGAAGYLTKDSAPKDLVTAIRRVAEGGRFVSISLAEMLACNVATDTEQPRHDRLSARELHVMREVAAGRTMTKIARDLSLSVKTISTYRARILQKMGMTNNAELIHYAIHHKLLD